MKIKFNRFHRPVRLLAALALILAAIPAYATSYYWDGTDSSANADGGNGTWDTATTNWDTLATGGANTAWVTDNQAVFATPGGTVTLGANITTTGNGTIGGLHFTSGNYIIDTNGYTLTVKQGSDRAIRVGNGTTATIQGSGSVVLGNNLIFQPDTTGSLIVSCKITGNFSLSKWSSGALTLSNNANDFKGKLYTQNGGSVSVSSIKDSGVASAAGAGSLIEFGAGAGNTFIYTGSGDSTNRTLSLAAPGVNQALRNNGTGALVWTGPFQNNISTARTFILGGNNTGNNEMQAAMADNGGNVLSITKADAGKWILSGNNTYTGATDVNGGTLLVYGNCSAATGVVSVSAGATLGGNGSLGGNTTIQPNGGLAFNISTAPGSHDRLDFAGSLTFNGTTNLTITTTGNASTGNYTLASAAGGITGSAPANLSLPSGWNATASVSGNDLVLNVTSLGAAPPANVTFTSSGQSVAEAAGTAVLTVTATGASGDITANVTFDAGNSTASLSDIGSYTTQTVTLNATNSYTANVTVAVTNDNIPEGDETAVFNLTDVAGGNAVSPTTHTLTILANDSFAAWASGYGLNGSLTDNFDADKFTDGEEYAFDLDPTVKEYGNVLASSTGISGSNVTMTLAFNGNSSKQDINYVVRRANNPLFTGNTVVGFWNGTANWTTSNSTYFGNETQSGAGDVKAINVNMSIPAASEPRQFLRVNIE